jgi:hypothetical protein
MTKHPRNKAERRLIEAKKKKKRVPMTRAVELSQGHACSAVEAYLFSMRLIDADERVVFIANAPNGLDYFISLEKMKEQEGSVN